MNGQHLHTPAAAPSSTAKLAGADQSGGQDGDDDDEGADLQTLLRTLQQQLSLAKQEQGGLVEKVGDLGQASNESEDDVAQLLARMDEADEAAQGIEGRLDKLLGELDGMLGALGETSTEGDSQTK